MNGNKMMTVFNTKNIVGYQEIGMYGVYVGNYLRPGINAIIWTVRISD